MSKKLFSVLGLLLAMTLVAAACGDNGGTTTPTDDATAPDDVATTDAPTTDDPTDDPTAPPGDGEAVSVAYQGPLTGANAALGVNMLRGIQLAVAEAPECTDSGFDISIEELDSQGDPAQAPPLAQGAAANEAVVAVIGPSFSGETGASGPIYEEAGLTFLSPSATNPDLTDNGWEFFHRTVATDATQGPVAAKFIYDNLGATQAAVLDDASEYGKGLADIVAESLADNDVEVVVREGVEAGTQDYSAIVGQVAQSGATAVFYGGYFSDAGLIRSQLVDQGAGEVTFVSGDGTFDGEFINVAGADAAEGSYVSFPGADPLSADPEFLEAYNAMHDADPGAFTIEAYQNALIICRGLGEVGADRAALNDFISNFDQEVFGKQISFDEVGDIAAQTFFLYQVEGGVWVQKEEVTA